MPVPVVRAVRFTTAPEAVADTAAEPSPLMAEAIPEAIELGVEPLPQE